LQLEKIKAMGYMYVFSPILTGVSVLIIIAFLLKNISKSIKYPLTV
jgi:CBS-domain-containing membrane protein